MMASYQEGYDDERFESPVQLVSLATCEFSAVQCSNDGCEVIINRRDQLNHEMNDCNFRQGKCEVCGKNVAYAKRKFHCYVTRNEMPERKIDEMSSMTLSWEGGIRKVEHFIL